MLERAIANREAAGRELFCVQAQDRADGDLDLSHLSDRDLELIEAALAGDRARVDALMTRVRAI